MLSVLTIAMLALRPPVEEPRLLPNGWHYGEAGNYCMAIRQRKDGARLSMRLAKWDDMSDSILLWAPGLKPLWTSDEEQDRGADEGYHLSIAVDGRTVPAAGHATMLDGFDGKEGPTYRIGIAQKAFIAALAKGKTLEVRLRGKPVAAFAIAGSAAMAKEFGRCVDKPPSF